MVSVWTIFLVISSSFLASSLTVSRGGGECPDYTTSLVSYQDYCGWFFQTKSCTKYRAVRTERPSSCRCCNGYSGVCGSCKPVCSRSCLNGGVCRAPESCQCTPKFSGNRCQRPICNPPCANGGKCKSAGQFTICQCVGKFTGPTCEHTTSEIRQEAAEALEQLHFKDRNHIPKSAYLHDVLADNSIRRSEINNCLNVVKLDQSSGLIATGNLLLGEKYYRNEIKCVKALYAPAGMKIVLIRELMDIEATTGCHNDFIQLWALEKINSKIIGRYCGHSIPPRLEINNGQVAIQIYSDRSVSGMGLYLRYRFVKNSFTSPSDCFRPLLKTISYTDWCGFWIGRRCTKTKTMVSGLKCECCSGYTGICGSCKPIECVFNTTIKQVERRTFQCGSGRCDDLTADGPAGVISNQPSGSLNCRCCNGYIGLCGNCTRDPECFYTERFSQSKGLIASGNLRPLLHGESPVELGANLDCGFSLTAPEHYIVRLRFVDFDIRLSTDCRSAHLQIFDGERQLLRPHCGTHKPEQLVSRTRFLYFGLSTGSAPLNGMGFKVMYDFVTSEQPVPSGLYCGLSYLGQSRIVGGSPSSVAAWPWQVGVYNGDAFVCGAVLIDEATLLSAAHCFFEKNVSNFQFVLGDLDREREEGREQRTRAVDITIHPDYHYASDENDIAVITLQQRVRLNTIVNPVCTPSQDERVLANQTCVVTGWGTASHQNDAQLATILQEVEVPIVAQQICQEAYGSHRIFETNLCAGSAQGGSDACKGDSGGPLVCKDSKNTQWSVHGIVSWGKGCGLANFYGVYTRVSAYADWINTVRESNSWIRPVIGIRFS